MRDLEEIKITVRSILTSFKHGCPINTLNREYQETCGEPLPYRKFGFHNAAELLHKMPEVARFGFDKQGDEVIFAVSTAATEHVASLVRHQKSAPAKKVAASKSIYGSLNQRNRHPVPNRYHHQATSSSSKPNAKTVGGGGSYANYYRNKTLSTQATTSHSNNYGPVFNSNCNGFSLAGNKINNNNGNAPQQQQQRPPKSPSPPESFSGGFATNAALRRDGFESWKSDRKKLSELFDITTIGLNPAGFTSSVSPKAAPESIFNKPAFNVQPSTSVNNNNVSSVKQASHDLSASNMFSDTIAERPRCLGRGMPFNFTRTVLTSPAVNGVSAYGLPGRTVYNGLTGSYTSPTLSATTEPEKKTVYPSPMEFRKFLALPITTTVCDASATNLGYSSIESTRDDVKLYYDEDSWGDETPVANRASVETALNRNVAELANLKITVSQKDCSSRSSVVVDNSYANESFDSVKSTPNNPRRVEVYGNAGKSSTESLVRNGFPVAASPVQPSPTYSGGRGRGSRFAAASKSVRLEDIPQDMVFKKIIPLSNDNLKRRAESDG